jgi:hypothetical protein
VRDLRHEVLREIRRADTELARIAALSSRDRTIRLDRWLDRRLVLMLARDQLTTLGFTVTDRRRTR